MNERYTYRLPEGASEEARRWVAEAQERLARFAADPSQRIAYEREQMERLLHNTLIEEATAKGVTEGRAEGRTEGITEARISNRT